MEPKWKHAEDLDLTAVDDGFIAYDQARDRVHYLNHTAALVFVLCCGRITAEDMAGLVQVQFDLEEPPRDEVESILARFAEEGLAAPVHDKGTAS